MIAKDGRRVPVEVSSRAIYENGVIVGVQGTARDITERKQTQDTLRMFSRQLIEAQEDERRRIAQRSARSDRSDVDGSEDELAHGPTFLRRPRSGALY